MSQAYKLKVTRTVFRGAEFLPEQEYISMPVVEEHFDARGYKIFECQYDSLGEPEYIMNWQYDEAGRLSVYTETDPGQEFSFREETHYKSDGKIDKKIIFYADSSNDREIYRYNTEGLLTETRRITDENETEEIVRKEYEGHLLIREYTEIPGEGISAEKKMIYNKKGVLVEKIEEKEEEFSRTVYEYSPEGQLVKTIVFNSEGDAIQEFEILARNGEQVLGAREKVAGAPEKRIESVYDDQGRLMREITRLADGSLFSEIIRMYDENDRLVQQKVITGPAYASAPQYLRYDYTYEPLE
ncbi:MAG: hypothetical protein ACP5O2_04080 [Bacteroidales bacterium]